MTSVETWKEIQGFEAYLVSDMGNVFSKASNKEISKHVVNRGYYRVNLWKNGKGKTAYVHRLVLQTFGEGYEKETVNHIDGNKLNNHINNLEWSTYSENNKHAIDTGLNGSKQRRNKKGSIQVEQRDLNGNLIETYPSFRQAERETGVTATEIGIGIKKGWKYGGFIWTLPTE
ncbi:HNH endonuclease [Carnobacterium jeotgali]|uniref:HNH endonuclease n=1 Tax=Carnobacterium jeotgali TaxID=545534 RepID=UPI00388DEDD3